MEMTLTCLKLLRRVVVSQHTLAGTRLFRLTAAGCNEDNLNNTGGGVDDDDDDDDIGSGDYRYSNQALQNMSQMSKKLRKNYETLVSANPYAMPWHISKMNVEALNATSNYKERMKRLTILGRDELKRMSRKNSKKMQRQQVQLRTDGDAENRNAAFRKIMLWLRKADEVTHAYHKLVYASKFGQNIVIDCSFESLCSSRMMTDLRNQLKKMIVFNRNLQEPFNFWLCNVRPDSLINTDYFMNEHGIQSNEILNMTEKSYLELFARNELVYLTPDSKNLLERVDRTKTYIIGGFPDFSGKYPLETLGKAKLEGVTHACISSPLVTTKLVHCETIFRALQTGLADCDGDAGAGLEKVMPKFKLKSAEEVSTKHSYFKRFGYAGRRRQ